MTKTLQQYYNNTRFVPKGMTSCGELFFPLPQKVLCIMSLYPLNIRRMQNFNHRCLNVLKWVTYVYLKITDIQIPYHCQCSFTCTFWLKMYEDCFPPLTRLLEYDQDQLFLKLKVNLKRYHFGTVHKVNDACSARISRLRSNGPTLKLEEREGVGGSHLF